MHPCVRACMSVSAHVWVGVCTCVRVPYVIIMMDLGKSIIVNQHWFCGR